MTREELLQRKPTHDFEMTGDGLIARTMYKDFDGYKIDPKTLYRCRWYQDINIWFIEPKYTKKRLKHVPKIVGVRKKS